MLKKFDGIGVYRSGRKTASRESLEATLAQCIQLRLCQKTPCRVAGAQEKYVEDFVTHKLTFGMAF